MLHSDRTAYEHQFEKTLSEYHPMLARLISSYEYIPALQEELYQEISVALWKALAKFDQKSSLKTYILSIAHKRAVSHVAKHVKQPFSIAVEEKHLGHADCPSQSMLEQEKMKGLMSALRSFNLVDRQLITLALEGLSYKDIAEVLGLTVTHVGVKLNRAKTKLNLLLSQQVVS
jgi:RNA polymerase sigma factor (sigma-70 family)